MEIGRVSGALIVESVFSPSQTQINGLYIDYSNDMDSSILFHCIFIILTLPCIIGSLTNFNHTNTMKS